MFKVIEKDLTKFSTIRTSSFTKYFSIINSADDMNKAMSFIKEKEINFKIIGNGSNILFSKEYYDNILFLKLGDNFNKINFFDTYVEIGGSFSLIQAGRKLINRGYPDFIFFNLIPATIGGAVRQNAGTGKGEEIIDVCYSASIYDFKKNQSIEMSLNDLDFSYRSSIIKKYPNRYIILSAKFKLENKTTSIDELILKMKNRVKEKIDREPKGFCFGSTFMNLDKPAWEYIDMIYKDLEKCNKINFSIKHKNWIINNGYSGEDVKKLIKDAQKMLYDNFFIKLKEEVDII
tara:strand:- start:285 stop:1154 length:870 start_codon:yes stop_codon:yes gene_type:complete